MQHSVRSGLQRWLTTILHGLLAVLMLVGAAAAGEAQAAAVQPVAQTADQGTVPAAPAWLEPRGVNVVDLVGVVPEDVLRNSMVVYSGGNALAYYESGTRSGGTVTIYVSFVSKDNRGATCLGMPGDFDSWPTVMPAGTLRILAGKADVTRDIVPSFELIPAGQIQPVRNTGSTSGRYDRTTQAAQFDSSGALILPANMGCKLFLTSGSAPLIGIFTMQTPPLLTASVLGSQSIQFRSYIGPGYSGQLAALQQQMSDKYGNRHDDLNIKPPSGAEFVWVRYPHTPVAPWDPASPAGGTYRIRRQNQKLSVDHQNSMAIPLYGQFQDADQSPGTKFLPYFTDSIAVSSPEYFVPTGVAYDPCMTNGGCPDSLLQTIYDARMEMTVYYLRLERVQGGLEQVSLAQVGPAWTAGAQPSAQAVAAKQTVDVTDVTDVTDVVSPAGVAQEFKLHLPYVTYNEPLAPDNPAANCPCGWFAADGRMLDLVQPQ
jgi:hypothetical protein